HFPLPRLSTRILNSKASEPDCSEDILRQLSIPPLTKDFLQSRATRFQYGVEPCRQVEVNWRVCWSGPLSVPLRAMSTNVPVGAKVHWHSQYDRSGCFSICIYLKFPKSGSLIFGGASHSLRLCRKPMGVASRTQTSYAIVIRGATVTPCWDSYYSECMN